MSTQPTPIVAVDPAAIPATPEVAPAVVPAVDDIEKGADGLYRLVVGNKVYKAKTIKLLLQETAKAIQSGDTRIRELNTELKIKRGVITPDKADDLVLPEVQPITTDEAFQLAQDLMRPDGMTKAIRRVVEAELGAPLESIKDERSATKSSQFRERALAAGRAFMEAHPEFIPSRANEEKMFDYMEQNNIQPISLKNYEIAYSQIKDALDIRDESEIVPPAAPVPEVVPEPAAPAAQPTPAAPTAPAPPARPRQATTGVTNRNSSAPNGPVQTLQGLPGFPTRETIERMTAKEMEKWMGHPRFQEHYDLVYGKKK